LIGIFDSGAGGITAVKEVRRISKTADIVFFPDRLHAPYGTKSPEELIPLVERDVELLLSFGAETVLMACCTASTVHPFLKSKLRDAAIPIISPTAKAAAKAQSAICWNFIKRSAAKIV
jgi:glutamate racemase